MATRFYLPGAGSAPISPVPDSAWEVISGVNRYPLVFSSNRQALITASSNTQTVPITTTQDILAAQFISEPLRAQAISGTFSLVVRASENAATVNATLAVSVRLISNDGSTVRGTFFSVFGTDTEFDLTAAPSTRIVNAAIVTPLTAQTGDRIVVEIGVNAAAPTTSDTVVLRTINSSATADYALTSALTTSLNPWCEFSQNLFAAGLVNGGLRPHLFSPGNAR